MQRLLRIRHVSGMKWIGMGGPSSSFFHVVDSRCGRQAQAGRQARAIAGSAGAGAGLLVR